MIWRPYLRNRLINDDPTGFVAIKPADAAPSIPLACPICKFMMRSRDDEAAYYDCTCCYRCAMIWAHPRRQLWKDGWRPSQEQVDEAEASRVPLTTTIDVV